MAPLVRAGSWRRAFWARRCVMMVFVAAALVGAQACGDANGADGPGVTVRVLPQVTDDTPAGLLCEPSARQRALNDDQGAVNIGAVRLEVFDADGQVVLDRVREVAGQVGSLLFEQIPPGEDYRLEITACRQVDDPGLWAGQVPSVDVSVGRNARTQVLLLPTEGFACAQQQPQEPLAFASTFSPDGRSVWVAGGLTSWTSQGPAEASDVVWRYDLNSGAFEDTGARLPQPTGMAASLVAAPAPGQPDALLLVGGASSIVEGFTANHGDLLAFGPPEGATVGSSVWVESVGDSITVRPAPWAPPARFGAGAGVSRSEDGDRVIVAGGIDTAQTPAQVSQQLTVVRLGPDGPEAVTVAMAAPRIAPVIHSPQPGLFWIIGGNIGAGTPLVEQVDVRGGNLSVSVLQVTEDPASAELMRPAAFSAAIPGPDGVTIVGGLPVFTDAEPDAIPIASAAISPVLFRLEETQPGQLVQRSVTLGPGTTAALSQRAFALVLERPEGHWLIGGIGDDVALPFKPRADAVLINDGGLAPSPEPPPYHPIGGSGATLEGGSSLAIGGLIELAEAPNQFAPTRTSLLRSTHPPEDGCQQPE